MTDTINSEYVLLSLDELITPFHDCEVYLDRDTEMVLYRDTDKPLTQDDIQQLKSDGRMFIFVTRDDFRTVGSFKQLASKKASRKIAAIQDDNREKFERVVDAGVNETIDYCNELGANLSEIIHDEPIIASEMFMLLQHHYTTYTHCLGVAINSGLLAKALGIGRPDTLREIVIGGLLHDIGKQRISQELLDKPGELTAQERQLLKEHPLAGYNILVQRDQGSWGQRMMVYQHHEKPNGTGYPVGIVADEIHPWAKICAVADVFHALTSPRSYREPASPAEACDYLIDQGKTYNAFDEEIVQCWKITMAATTA